MKKIGLNPDRVDVIGPMGFAGVALWHQWLTPRGRPWTCFDYHPEQRLKLNAVFRVPWNSLWKNRREDDPPFDITRGVACTYPVTAYEGHKNSGGGLGGLLLP